MKAIHTGNCKLWIQYQSPDLHLGPKFSYSFCPSPLSPFNSFVLIIHWVDNWRTNSSEIKGLSSSPAQKSFQRASPCLFSAPLPPSLQQPAGTLLLCYSWPACSCSYSPRLTQQQLLCVCQLASRSPKSSCPPRSPLLLPHLRTCFSFPTTSPTCHNLLQFPVFPTVLSLPHCCPGSPYLLSRKHPLLSLSSLWSSNRSSLKWRGEYCS